jgi:hypothetical protein
VECTMGDELVHFPFTVTAFGQRFFRNFLHDLVDPAATVALVLINWHFLSNLPDHIYLPDPIKPPG